jgi:eukaryotic-like serine/threonine-protein kinase
MEDADKSDLCTQALWVRCYLQHALPSGSLPIIAGRGSWTCEMNQISIRLRQVRRFSDSATLSNKQRKSRPSGAMVDILRKVALFVGQTVGDYRVTGVIGEGGMGTVYKVRHLISDRIEAIKIILPDVKEMPGLADRFMREIKVQARLSHPNIASLHNVVRFEDQFLMVMEYVDGLTLHARLRQGRLTTDESVTISVQILSALAYAHGLGVIHRDIKPANIMFTCGGSVKLMDFGIARSLTDQHLTSVGAAVGSLYYMSPEQVRGAEVDGRSDLYSVGVVLYEMLTGVRPIEGEGSWGVMNGHLHQLPQPPIALNPRVPPELSLSILRALEKNPANRFRDAAEFSDILQGICNRSTSERAEIPEPVELRTPTHTPSPLSTPSPTSTPTPFYFEPAGMERLTRELANYVGPMARVLVNRAARKAHGWRQLYDALALEIEEPAERKRFLASRRG